MDQGMRAYVESKDELQNTPAATLMPTMWNPNARPTWLGGTGGIPRAEYERARAAVTAPVKPNFEDYEAVTVEEVNDEVNSVTDSDIAMDRKMEDNERSKAIKKSVAGAALLAILAVLGKNKAYIRGYPSDLTKDMPIKDGAVARASKTADEQGWTLRGKPTDKETNLQGFIDDIDDLLNDPKKLADDTAGRPMMTVEHNTELLLSDRAKWVALLYASA